MKKSVLGTYGLQILNVFFSFFMSIALARILGANERGLLVIFLTSSSFLSSILEFCLGSAITYFIASNKFDISRTFTTVIYWTLFTLLLIITLTFFIPNLNLQQFIYGQKDNITFSLKFYFILVVVLSVFNALMSAIFIGMKNFKLINYLSLGPLILSTLFYSILLYLKYYQEKSFITLDIIFITALILSLRTFALVFFYFKKNPPGLTNMILSFNEIKSLFSLSLINYISNTVQFLTYKMDFWFVNFYEGPKILGVYSLAVNLAQLFWMLPNSVGAVLFPNIASMDNEKSLLYTKMLCRIVFTITFLLGCFGGFIFAYLIPYLYGNQFLPSSLLFLILLIGVLPFSIKIIISSYYGGIKKTNLDMIGSIIAFVVCITLDFLLIPNYGAKGAAYASIFAYLCNTLFMIISFKKITGSNFKSFLIIQKSDIRLLISYIPKSRKKIIQKIN
jgi:O-antigen/teichoic acid export membrane protein